VREALGLSDRLGVPAIGNSQHTGLASAQAAEQAHRATPNAAHRTSVAAIAAPTGRRW